LSSTRNKCAVIRAAVPHNGRPRQTRTDRLLERRRGPASHDLRLKLGRRGLGPQFGGDLCAETGWQGDPRIEPRLHAAAQSTQLQRPISHLKIAGLHGFEEFLPGLARLVHLRNPRRRLAILVRHAPGNSSPSSESCPFQPPSWPFVTMRRTHHRPAVEGSRFVAAIHPCTSAQSLSPVSWAMPV
jgi:hypothetical protein